MRRRTFQDGDELKARDVYGEPLVVGEAVIVNSGYYGDALPAIIRGETDVSLLIWEISDGTTTVMNWQGVLGLRVAYKVKSFRTLNRPFTKLNQQTLDRAKDCLAYRDSCTD
tara:strand:+ start:321 stop:656 length:336 start_codon:yes stop_codon:yes gene_type:complete